MRERSAELLASGARWLDDARAALDISRPDTAGANAYFAMLYAARAALSEEGRTAKTHAGTWTLVGELLVSPGRLDRDLYREARKAEARRVAVHYETASLSLDEAAQLVDHAETFAAAVRRLIE